MDPYFVPQLALLLMEGVGRRALSQANNSAGDTFAPAGQTAPIPEERGRRLARADATDRQNFRVIRHFGWPGPLR